VRQSGMLHTSPLGLKLGAYGKEDVIFVTFHVFHDIVVGE
jgi:hypothetical protein